MPVRSSSSIVSGVVVLISAASFGTLPSSLPAQGARRAIIASAGGASCAQPIAGFAARCARYFPDSLKLTDAQNQNIVRLRDNFSRDHASQLQQLRSYTQYAQSAGQTGSSAARSGAITVQGDSLRAVLRAAQKQLDVQIEKTLTPGQLAFVKAGQPVKRGKLKPTSN